MGQALKYGVRDLCQVFLDLLDGPLFKTENFKWGSKLSMSDGGEK